MDREFMLGKVEKYLPKASESVIIIGDKKI